MLFNQPGGGIQTLGLNFFFFHCRSYLISVGVDKLGRRGGVAVGGRGWGVVVGEGVGGCRIDT